MIYVVLYLVFGVVFVAGGVGYWVITRSLRDPQKIYVADPAAGGAPGGSRPQLGKA